MLTKAKVFIGNIPKYWKTPMKGRYMPFREIAAYSGGGIGAYFIITVASACILSMGNTLISSTLGIDATDMYIMYVAAVLLNVPLTAMRANIIDNTRRKAGKYRPYIVSMAIPTAVICTVMVWFPYDKLKNIVGTGIVFGESADYVAKCAIIMILNFLLHFFYYFFYDGYENLIHVLSPDSQERADVASVKSIVYSFSPTITNLITPIVAQNLFHTNTTDIRVYRLLYPIFCIFGILLCIVVYKYTEEKIVQARTHIVQIRFLDALREVAKNKYFWIISLAGWLGFLESSYANILNWLYNYGGACSGTEYGIIVTVYGNASLWGMLLAPFCIRKWGKKAVLVVTNLFNIAFILLMLPVTQQVSEMTIWIVMGCLYLNAFMGSFALILNPSIQADIRDYQQYKTGERIDGMFSAVATIGTVITLVTSSVLPVIYEKGGITKENAALVTADSSVLSRMLGDGKTVGEILSEQLANGQDNYTNAYSALYNPDTLLHLLHVLILFSAVGALLNVIPYFWYDFTEKKQKSVVRVLQVRAMFEDYSNGALKDEMLTETMDMIRDAKEKASAKPIPIDKARNKKDKKAYKEARLFNEEIEISKFVCEELDKFSSPVMMYRLRASQQIWEKGLQSIKLLTKEECSSLIKAAKRLPGNSPEEKEIRKFEIESARRKADAVKACRVFFGNEALVKPDFAVLDGMYEREDAVENQIKHLYADLKTAKKEGNRSSVKQIKKTVKEKTAEVKKIGEEIKRETDRHANFNRAARPFIEAEKMIVQYRNYNRFDEIEALYEKVKSEV